VVSSYALMNSNARKAGVQIGDEVLRLNSMPYHINRSKQMDKYLGEMQVGDPVELDVLRNGREIHFSFLTQQAPSMNGFVRSQHLLFWYGLLANVAGHPGIANATAERLERQWKVPLFGPKYREIFLSEARQEIVLLRAVALARNGQVDQAYQLLLDDPSIKSDETWGVNHFRWYPDLLADLHKDPKKLAYILGKKVEELPELGEKQIQRSKFWTLHGDLVKPTK
jgi:hypothetical protein